MWSKAACLCLLSSVSLLLAIPVGCGEDDAVTVKCAPVEAGSAGCAGLPPGAGASSAVYPESCQVRVVSDGETTVWWCDLAEGWMTGL